MKKMFLKSGIFALCLAMSFAFAACNDDRPQDGESLGEEAVAARALLKEQADSAAQTYTNLLTEPLPEGTNTAKASAFAAVEEGENASPSYEDALGIFLSHAHTITEQSDLIQSFIGDIFGYSSVQLSIIEQYGAQSLSGQFTMDYSSVDAREFSHDKIGGASTCISSSLLTASFAGVDEATGRVYCTQTHKAMGTIPTSAVVEFYYNFPTDMGVTTLNIQQLSDGERRFDYNFFNLADNLILHAYADVQADGSLGEMRATMYMNTVSASSASFSEDELATVTNFVLGERERINKKHDEVAALNAPVVQRAQFAPSEQPPVVMVDYDISVLMFMLGRAEASPDEEPDGGAVTV